MQIYVQRNYKPCRQRKPKWQNETRRFTNNNSNNVDDVVAAADVCRCRWGGIVARYGQAIATAATRLIVGSSDAEELVGNTTDNLGDTVSYYLAS